MNNLVPVDSIAPPDERNDLYFTEMYNLTEVSDNLQCHMHGGMVDLVNRCSLVLQWSSSL